MDDGKPFVADMEAAEAMQPGQGALDDPTGAAEARAVRAKAMGEDGRDPALPELRAMRAGVIAAIPFAPAAASDARGPASPPIGGMASTSGSNSRMSLWLAAVRCATTGMPCASVKM